MAPYASINDELERLVGRDEALVERALLTGQWEMFDSFREGRLVVPPDTSLISDSDQRDAFEAALVSCNEALAAWHLTQHLSDASDKINTQAAFWREWLARVAAGSMVLSGLEVIEAEATASLPAFAIAGDTRNVFTPSFFNTMRDLTGDAH